MLRIDLLGPLRIQWQGQSISPGPLRLQALLAVLALRANKVCTPAELFDLVWSDNPPGTGLKVLPPYVYRLRRVLPVEDVLERTAEGYVLRLPEESLDVTRFESQVKAAEQVGDPDRAADLYQQALSLYRGEPLSGLPGEYLAAQRRRLAERRDKVFADRVDTDLRRGRAAAVVAELIPAVAARPFDERLAGQLMRALFDDGRQAEALTVYADTRATLIDQLGVEPGPELREIHQLVLRNEPAPTRGRDELPYAGAVFVGRSGELRQLTDLLSGSRTAAPPVVAIDGMAGAGKTALAVNAARRLATSYPDGLLFVDLHGHTPGRAPLDTKAALDHLLAAAGVSPQAIPHDLDEAQALWRSTIAGRRLLVILDNAPDSAAVGPLLPGSPTCGILITSRNQLTGLDLRKKLHLDLLTPEVAADLLVELVGRDRINGDWVAAQALAERCDGLPLAVRIAAARLQHRPAWTVDHINQRLDVLGRRLSELATDGVGVAAAFQLSYDQLEPSLQRAFRLLGLLPGRDIDQYGAAALLGTSPETAESFAESLVDANLLLEPRPGRYEFHDLLREYAGELARTEESQAAIDQASDGLLEYYLQASFHPLAANAGMNYVDIGPRPQVALPQLDTLERSRAWADAEALNLAVAVERAAAEGRDEYAWMLALGSARFLVHRGSVQRWNAILHVALEVARRRNDVEAQGRVLYALGWFSRGVAGAVAAADFLRQALDLLPPDEYRLLRAQILCSFGLTMQAVDPYGTALPALLESARLARELEDDSLLRQALAYTGILYVNQLNLEPARETLEQALVVCRRLGRTGLMADTLSALAATYFHLGRLEEALETATAAYELATELDNIFSLPFALAQVGRVRRGLGELDEAVRIHQESLELALASRKKPAELAMQLHLADSLLARGDLGEAQERYDTVLRAAAVDKDQLGMMKAWEGLADCAAAAGERDEAADHLHRALAIAEEFHPPHAGRIQGKLAELER